MQRFDFEYYSTLLNVAVRSGKGPIKPSKLASILLLLRYFCFIQNKEKERKN